MAYVRSLFPSMLRNWWDAWDFPESIYDQHVGTALLEEDMYPPMYHYGYVVRLRTKNAVLASGQSEVRNEADKFQIKLNVVHFKPEEIQVKVVNDYVVIRCKHEEKSDDSGFIQREFTRRYILPEGTEAATVSSSLSLDGILIIEALKKAPEDQQTIEHSVPLNVQKKDPPVVNCK